METKSNLRLVKTHTYILLKNNGQYCGIPESIIKPEDVPDRIITDDIINKHDKLRYYLIRNNIIMKSK